MKHSIHPLHAVVHLSGDDHVFHWSHMKGFVKQKRPTSKDRD